MAHTCSTSLICFYSTANWFPPLVGSLYTKLVFEPSKNPPKMTLWSPHTQAAAVTSPAPVWSVW